MEAAVAKMLAKDPNDRFATMTRMVDALRRGLENGEVMDDEVARRRESVPPPSVSRVMQKLGMQSDAPLPAPVAPAPALASASAPAAKPFDGKSTQVGTPPAPAAAAAPKPAAVEAPISVTNTQPLARVAQPPAMPAPSPSPATTAPLLPAMPAPSATAPLPQMSSRRRTGTPRVGVPVVHDAESADAEPADDSQQPVAGLIDDSMSRTRRGVGESSGRVARPAASSGSAAQSAPRSQSSLSGRVQRPAEDPLNSSQVWFDAGDDDSKVRARKAFAPSLSDLDEYEPPKKNRIGLYAAIGAFLLAGGGVVLAFVGGSHGDHKTPPAPPAVAAVLPADAAASAVIPTPDPATPPAPAPLGSAQVVAVASPPVAPPPVAPVAPLRGHAPTAHAPTAHAPTAHAPTAHAPSRHASHDDPTGFTAPSYTPAVDRTPPPGMDDDPSSRRPTGLGGPRPAPTAPAHPSGVGGANGPVDPYAQTDAPADAGGDKKSEFYANLGTQQLASGDTAGAAASYQRATEIDPKNVTAVTGLGEIALRQGLFGDAIAHLNHAAKLAPRSSRVFTLLGEAYMNSGNNAQAVANFKKALQLDPDNSRAREGFNDASARVPPPTDD
jgi:hypothetical protein